MTVCRLSWNRVPRARRCQAVLVAIAVAPIVFANASPLVFGPNGGWGEEARAGVLLWSELGCQACHGGLAEEGVAAGHGPDLSRVGSRLKPGFVERFLLNPSARDAGTWMPDSLADLEGGEKEMAARALTAFLFHDESDLDSATESDGYPAGDPQEGGRRFDALGCRACHTAQAPGVRSAPGGLAHVGGVTGPTTQGVKSAPAFLGISGGVAF